MSLITKILVPTDFSAHASKALDFAIELASRFGASLEILHCYQINPGGISPYGIVYPENLDREIREVATSRPEDIVELPAKACVARTLLMSGRGFDAILTKIHCGQ